MGKVFSRITIAEMLLIMRVLGTPKLWITMEREPFMVEAKMGYLNAESWCGDYENRNWRAGTDMLGIQRIELRLDEEANPNGVQVKLKDLALTLEVLKLSFMDARLDKNPFDSKATGISEKNSRLNISRSFDLRDGKSKLMIGAELGLGEVIDEPANSEVNIRLYSFVIDFEANQPVESYYVV